MFAKLEGLEKKYMELEKSLSDPDVYSDQDQFRNWRNPFPIRTSIRIRTSFAS